MNVKIKREVFNQIKETIGKCVPEAGGVLGCKKNIICSYYFDSKSSNYSKYEPSITDINATLIEWRKNEIYFAGIIHSHPNDCNSLSKSDIDSIIAIFEKTNFSGTLFFPIVTNHKKFAIRFYFAKKSHIGIVIKKAKYSLM